MTVSKFMQVLFNLFKNIKIEALYLGNVDSSDAEAAREIISKAAESSTGMAKNKHPKQDVIVLHPKHEENHVIIPTLDPKEPNTAVEIYVQCGKDNIEERVLIDLLVQIMYEPLFDQLRTKE